ncbi:MAG: hypothetical protein M3503_02450 [Actinomycetota bacterium]|nr:hypothetical protein [Actinomycetota bacterium]
MAVRLGEPVEDAGELASAGLVDALEEPEVTGGGQGDDVVVGEPGRPVAEHEVDREVLVDHQHDGDRSVVVVAVVAAEERVGREVSVERCLELVGEVASGDAPQDLATLRGDARIPGATPAAPFLEELFADGHGLHSASDPCEPVRRWLISRRSAR